MKLTMKLFLIMSLFCATAFANEGDMNHGHRDGETCTECPGNLREEHNEDEKTIIKFIKDYLEDILGI